MKVSVGLRSAAFALLVGSLAGLVRAQESQPVAAAPPAEVVAPALEPAAPWPPPAPQELPDRDAARARVDAAWRQPGGNLEQRVERAQRAAFSLGIRELEGPARALIFDANLGDPLLRAELAVRLAPSLPAAHAALAEARFAAGDVQGAASALGDAARSVPGHLEARAWAGTVGFRFAVLGAFFLALLYLSISAVASLPTLVRGLSASRLALPGPSALALFGCLVLLPALLEGPAGALLGLAALAISQGEIAKRAAVALVCVVAGVALHSGIDRYAASQLALSADPVGVAVHRVERGLATPSDVGVVLRAAVDDPLAARAAALQTKRAGELHAARGYFRRVETFEDDAGALNNAANVEFSLGEAEAAIALYEKATRVEQSPVVLFNLAQAYGRVVRLDEQDHALARAQAIDALALDRLASALASGAHTDVADAAVSAEQVLARVEATGQPAELAEALRARVAPGWLGRGPASGGVALALVCAAAIAAGRVLGKRAGPRNFYADIARTLQAGVGDSAQRIAQLTRLRSQRARNEGLLTLVALAVPGAAGVRWGRPLLALVACLAFSGALALALCQIGAAAEPFALGTLPDQLARVAYIGFGGLYALATGLAFLMRAED